MQKTSQERKTDQKNQRQTHIHTYIHTHIPTDRQRGREAETQSRREPNGRPDNDDDKDNESDRQDRPNDTHSYNGANTQTQTTRDTYTHTQRADIEGGEPESNGKEDHRNIQKAIYRTGHRQRHDKDAETT